MQVKAIAQAAAARKAAGGDPRPEIMVPLVGAVQELEAVRVESEAVLAEVPEAPPIRIGTMIEVPRAALTAGQIAGPAEFFSFGTNDLTQMTWGFSRDDVEGAAFGRYLDLGIFAASPFETIDRDGVGELIRLFRNLPGRKRGIPQCPRNRAAHRHRGEHADRARRPAAARGVESVGAGGRRPRPYRCGRPGGGRR
jgi:hypothetical protein